MRTKNTNYKILYLNFNNTSPFNKNFAYFCEKYLYYNNNINIIILNNIGNINKDDNYIYSNKNIKKLEFPNLKCIIFENEIISNNINEIQNENIIEKDNIYNINEEIIFDPIQIKIFIDNFFDLSNFNIYEGYNDENTLIYLKIVKNISIDELYRIFFIQSKISLLILRKENIKIKYNRNKKELYLIYNVNEKENQLSYKIESFNECCYKLHEIMDLYLNNGEILNIENIHYDNMKKKIKEKNDNINFVNSEIITEEKEFSLLNEGISEIENIGDIELLKFNLIYRAKSDKNKIDTIIDKIGKNKYMLIIIKTNKGNIFGAYAYFYDYYYYDKDEDRNFGVVFNFTKEKLFYNAEGLIYKNDQGIEVKNYFYITKPSFGLKNKIINDLMEIGESNFICAKMEVYDINNK